jgi:hypothetical protein
MMAVKHNSRRTGGRLLVALSRASPSWTTSHAHVWVSGLLPAAVRGQQTQQCGGFVMTCLTTRHSTSSGVRAMGTARTYARVARL